MAILTISYISTFMVGWTAKDLYNTLKKKKMMEQLLKHLKHSGKTYHTPLPKLVLP